MENGDLLSNIYDVWEIEDLRNDYKNRLPVYLIMNRRWMMKE